MTKPKHDPEAYVREVTENTRMHLRELQEENQQLRTLVTQLKAELDRHQSHQEKLRQKLAEIEEENQQFSQRYVLIEQQTSNLSNLYVASYRLHETLDRAELLQVIEEILANIVGSEEVAIFEVEPGEEQLRLVRSVGIDASRYRQVGFGDGVIGRVALTGETFVSPKPAHERGDGLTACVPLRVAGKVTGAIAIFRMLPQKQELQKVDHEVFELLATQAGQALYCAKLHARMTGEQRE